MSDQCEELDHRSRLGRGNGRFRGQPPGFGRGKRRPNDQELHDDNFRPNYPNNRPDNRAFVNQSSPRYQRNEENWEHRPRDQRDSNQKSEGRNNINKDRLNWDNNDRGPQVVHHPKGQFKGGSIPPKVAEVPDIVKEIPGDLFGSPGDFSLAHCVGSDFRMGTGIAVKFKEMFKRVGELLDQNVQVGGCAHLQDNARWIFYLVIKEVSTGKPRMEDLRESLRAMKAKCLEFGVKKLAMPRIGCGLDKLDWPRVKASINEIFQDSDIEIRIYDFNVEGKPEADGNRPEFKNTLVVKNSYKKLVEIDDQTALIFLGTEDGYMDPTAVSLNEKHRFEQEYKSAVKTVGDVVCVQKPNYNWLFGLIVAKSQKDRVLFTTIESCVSQLSKLLRKDGFRYAGIEFPQNWSNDNIFFEKIQTLLRSFLFKGVQLWVCTPSSDMDVSKAIREKEVRDKGNVTQVEENLFEQQVEGSEVLAVQEPEPAECSYNSSTAAQMESFEKVDVDLSLLLSSLEEVALCPICLELLKPPVTLCVNGHGVCTTCKATLTKCPTCRKPFCSTEPRVLNEILQKIPKLCKYYEEGCRLAVTDDHELYCRFRTVKCIFHDEVSSEYCGWEGPAREFVNHVYINQHLERGYTDICDVSTIRFRKFKDIAPTISVFDDGVHEDDSEFSRHSIIFYYRLLNGNFCMYIKYLPLKKPTEIIYFTISFGNSTDDEVMYKYKIKATTMVTLERYVKVDENLYCMRVPVEELKKLVDVNGDLVVNYKKIIVPL